MAKLIPARIMDANNFSYCRRPSPYRRHANTFDDAAAESDSSNTESDRKIIPITPSYNLAKKAANDSYVDYTISAARWDNQHQPTKDFSLRLHKYTTSTTRFRLCTYIYPNGSTKNTKNTKNGNKTAVYLFIYPEDIQAVELQHSTKRHASNYSLNFNLRQPPQLVYAKDSDLDSKKKTKPCLDIMRGLANTKEFTLEINRFSMHEQAVEDLKSLLSTFPFHLTKVQQRINDRRAELDTLYAGQGGAIFELARAATHAEEVLLPPYSDIPPNSCQDSRKRSRIDGVVNTSHPLPRSNDPVLNAICDMQIEMAKGLLTINTRLDRMEHSFKELSDKIAEDLSNSCQCRFSTEEREDFRREIRREANEDADEIITEIKVEIKDAVDELNEKTDLIRRGVKRKMEKINDSIDDRMGNVAKEVVEETLQNAYFRIGLSKGVIAPLG